MKYLSLFSGIEAASVAWHDLGWDPVGFAEFDEFPSKVLATRFPNVPNFGDVTKITEEQIRSLGQFDIVVGGSPCQDLSMAGKRAGLRHENGDTTRSGLFDEQVRIYEIARKYNGCRYCLWENVPGALSSNNGNDFAYVLGSLAVGSVSVPFDGWKNSGLVINDNGSRIVEYRVLDAQFFGVPQRRRRIFALLDTGAWWSREPLLFEQEGLRGHFAQSAVEGEGVAEGTEECAGECGDPIAFHPTQDPISSTGKTHCMGTGTKNGNATIAVAIRTAQTGANGIGVAVNKSHTLDGANGQAIIYENHAQDSRVTKSVGICPTLHSQMGTGGGNVPLVLSSGQANAEIGKNLCPTLNCLHEAPIFCGEENE